MPTLFYSKEWGARKLAPYFLTKNGERFYFSDTPEQKWRDFPSENIQPFCERVYNSVRHNGVINPINVDQIEIDGELQHVVRHGATRLWAARLLDIKLPVVFNVVDGDPPEGAVELDRLDGLYMGRHDILNDNGVFRVKAKHVDRFPS